MFKSGDESKPDLDQSERKGVRARAESYWSRAAAKLAEEPWRRRS